jgi:hypothetical protein
MSKNSLRYYVYQQRLLGSVGPITVNMPAVSGGARGSVQKGRAESSLSSYDPRRISEYDKTSDSGRRGGSIPPGIWTVLPSSEYGGSIGGKPLPLVPSAAIRQAYPERDYDKKPFLIHGTGQLGSDGCIVIEKKYRTKLIEAVDKEGQALLTVIYEWDELMKRVVFGEITLA